MADTTALWACEPVQLGDTTMYPQVTDVAGRLQRVSACTDPAQLRGALDHPNLQKTVRTAIERRLRSLS